MTTHEPIGVGVIGAGYWGPNLVRNVQATPGLRLRYLCDLDVERAHRVASTYAGAASTADFQRVLDDPSVEAVAIATPPSTTRVSRSPHSERASTFWWRSRWPTRSRTPRR